MPEVETLTHTHDAIMNFMLANPALRMIDVAKAFNYSPAWISTLVHSNAFQVKMQSKQDKLFDRVGDSLTTKMHAITHDALEIVHDGLFASPNPKQALEVADTLLHRLGYAPNRPAETQAQVTVNNFVVSAADLAACRANIVGGGSIDSLTPAPPALNHYDPSSEEYTASSVHATTLVADPQTYEGTQASGGAV